MEQSFDEDSSWPLESSALSDTNDQGQLEEVNVQNGIKTTSDEEIHDSKAVENKWKVLLKKIIGNVVPQLTICNGKEKTSYRRSAYIVMMLYMSRSIAAWGDRMWTFAVTLLLVGLYPGSLLMPGVLGFLVQLFAAIFGTIVGDYVDAYPRRTVASLSLVVQNGMIGACSVVIFLMFYYDLNVCLHTGLFLGLVLIVMVLTAGAYLANVTNKISIEKDWAVVIADNNKDNLAVLNANMRRIDLCCKLLAPAATGVILQYANSSTTTIVIASWNMLSFFAELGLLLVVYQLVPALKVKKMRKFGEEQKQQDTEALLLNEDEDVGNELKDDGNDEEDIRDSLEMSGKNPDIVIKNQKFTSKTERYARKLCKFCLTFKEGWKIYIRQEIVLIGFSMACLYLTVLGFSGVTASYLLTQGLRQDLIGLFQGVGAIFGVAGTILYPFLHKRFGTIRTGLFGISSQVTLLSLCVIGVFLPSNRGVTSTGHYYAPDCPARTTNNDNMNFTSLVYPMVPTPSSMSAISTHAIQPTPCVIESTSTVAHKSLSPTLMPTPYPCEGFTSATASVLPITSDVLNPYTMETPQPPVNSRTSFGLYFLVAGVITCRIGLWTFDLAVQQLVQEKVVEEERGVVTGVMFAMNSINDMLHYGLVIAAPRPENFNILTVISFLMVSLGWVLYAVYVRKNRGHLTHFGDCIRKVKSMRHKGN